MPLAIELQALGFAPAQLQTIFGKRAIVAATGSAQTDAAAITKSNTVVTGADATKGVILPVCQVGESVQIVNDSASALKVYPPVGDAIGVPGTSWSAATANTSYSHTTFAVVTYTKLAPLLWSVNKSA